MWILRGVMVVALGTFVVACSGTDGGSSGSSSGGSSSGSTSSGGRTSGSTSSGGTTSGGTTKKEYGAQCKDSAECKSDFCVFRTGGSLGMCTQTCEGEIDCPGLDSTCVALSDAPQKVCVPK